MKLNNFIDEIDLQTALTVNYHGATITVLDSSNIASVKWWLKANFGDYAFIFATEDSETTAEAFIDGLKNKLTLFNVGYAAMFNVENMVYEPLQNYDSTETSKITSGNITRNYGANPTLERTKQAGYDGSLGTDSETYAGVSLDGSAISGDAAAPPVKTQETETDTQVHETKRSGNIGVTTSQQMAESEYAYRLKYNAVKCLLCMYLQETCFYGGTDI